MTLFAFVFVSCLTLAVLFGLLSDLTRFLQRPQLRPSPPPSQAPLVSLLIPARNEERAIARCLDGALAQVYPNLEVIVADDGSTDATAQILARYTDPRLRVLQGRPLPEGWIGKCNVCQQLSEAANGEWLIFLDADTAPQPELVSALLAHAERRRLDLLTVFPFLELGSFWERLILPGFVSLIQALFPFERMERDHARPDQIVANGQCILVRRQVYEAIGGHAAVRSEILEDVRLAQTVRAAGYRVGAAHGAEQLRVRMYTNGREVLEGLTKNAAAGYRSGGGRAGWAASRLILLVTIPFWLCVAGGLLVLRDPTPFAWSLLLHGVVTQMVAIIVWAYTLRSLYGLAWPYAVLHPFGVLGYMLIAMRGMWRVRSGRGVVWKGRTYEG